MHACIWFGCTQVEEVWPLYNCLFYLEAKLERNFRTLEYTLETLDDCVEGSALQKWATSTRLWWCSTTISIRYRRFLLIHNHWLAKKKSAYFLRFLCQRQVNKTDCPICKFRQTQTTTVISRNKTPPTRRFCQKRGRIPAFFPFQGSSVLGRIRTLNSMK